MSSCFWCRLIVRYLTARALDVHALAASALSYGLHVAKNPSEGLSQILHRVLGVLARDLRLAALPVERQPGRRRFFSASADGRRAAHRA